MDSQQILSLPAPPKTSTYSPVSHKNIFDEVQENLYKHNYHIQNTAISGARKGQQMIGYVDCANKNDPEIGFRVAFRNSYDKSMSVGFVAGNVVWICSNGIISGDIQYVRKHTGSVLQEMKQRIDESVTDLVEHYEIINNHSSEMKRIHMETSSVAELCGLMYIERDIIKATQLSVLKQEIANPTYDHGYPNTLWEFYNAVTHTMKKSHPKDYISQHTNFHKFIEGEYNL